jgi:hypothetical protein
MLLRRTLLLPALLALLLGSKVLAQDAAHGPRTPVLLHTADCADLAQAELRELVALELAPRPVLGAADAPAAPTGAQVTLICNQREARVLLRTHGRREYQVLLDFREIAPSARPRLVALALSELLATSEMESTPEPPAQREDASTAKPRGDRYPGRNVWLALGLARDGGPRLLSPLGELGLTWRLQGLPLGVDGKLSFGAGERALRLGRVQAWNLGAALALAYAPALGRLVLGLGAGVKLGYAALRGRGMEHSTGRRVAGLFWGPALMLSGIVTLSSRWALRAGLDVAYLLQRVEGLDPSGRKLFSFGGLQLHATLGVALGF